METTGSCSRPSHRPSRPASCPTPSPRSSTHPRPSPPDRRPNVTGFFSVADPASFLSFVPVCFSSVSDSCSCPSYFFLPLCVSFPSCQTSSRREGLCRVVSSGGTSESSRPEMSAGPPLQGLGYLISLFYPKLPADGSGPGRTNHGQHNSPGMESNGMALNRVA